jgi:lysine N6-hydroxylase
MDLTQTARTADYIGVGIGPSNLSLAALTAPVPGLVGQSFEKKTEFIWHPGLLLDNATIQVSHLKDLVTLVDPTNRYSFLSYLNNHKRLYRFITAKFPGVLRVEFSDYYRWATDRVPGLHFGESVEKVEFDDDQALFSVTTSRRQATARNIVLGTGLTPWVPSFCRQFLGANVIHASQFATSGIETAGKRVAIVGGGQTGAELVLNLIRGEGQPAELTWLSRRPTFQPIDDSPFVNELFFPPYPQYFYGLPRAMKARLLDEQKLASDGIDNRLLEEIYRRLYEIDCLRLPGCRPRLIAGHELVSAARSGRGMQLGARDANTGATTHVQTDVVILCTGYRYSAPGFLSPLYGRLMTDSGSFDVTENYAIRWDGPADRNIYLQNGARHSHGIADPNLSLMPWRNARIINDIVGYDHYEVDECESAMTWDPMNLPPHIDPPRHLAPLAAVA